jgi:hypothetical protein
MAYTYHGTSNLIALPNRTVQTYPSGLVRVERSFVCRKADVAKNRNTIRVNERMPMDDGAPAFDGLYIFPEPQEVVRDDGFVEFRVTAYGRTNIFSDSAITKGSVLGTYLRRVITEAFNFQDLIPAILDIFTVRGVLASSEPTSAILKKPNIENPSVIDLVTGRPLLPGEVVVPGAGTRRITSIDIALDSYSSINFGQWSEYTVTWKAFGDELTLEIPL